MSHPEISSPAAFRNIRQTAAIACATSTASTVTKTVTRT
jgi:hypothetical protein